jgi:hypothetical protein
MATSNFNLLLVASQRLKFEIDTKRVLEKGRIWLGVMIIFQRERPASRRFSRNLHVQWVTDTTQNTIFFHRIFVYTCKQSNIMCSCCAWPHGNGLVGFYSLQKLFKLCFFLLPIDNLSAQVIKVDINIRIHMWRGINGTVVVWRILRSPSVIKITVFVTAKVEVLHWFSGHSSVADAKATRFKQSYVAPMLKSSLQKHTDVTTNWFMWRGINGTVVVWRILRSPSVIKITVFVILEKK